MKKLLRMFVEMPETGQTPERGDLEDLLKQTDSILGPSPPSVETAPSTAPAPKADNALTALDWTLDQVFQAGKLATGANTADTVLKLHAGLAQFEPGQRLAMIRALDAASPEWDEPSVIEDAKRRILVLNHYLNHLAEDQKTKEAQADQQLAQATQQNNGQIAQLDLQIAELQAQREKLVRANADAEQKASERKTTVAQKAEARRAEVDTRCTEYRRIITFFEEG